MNASDLLAERLARPVTEARLNEYTSDLVEGVVAHWNDINEPRLDLLAGLDPRPDAQRRLGDPAARGVRGPLRDRGAGERRHRRGRRAGEEPVDRRLARSSSTACSPAGRGQTDLGVSDRRAGQGRDYRRPAAARGDRGCLRRAVPDRLPGPGVLGASPTGAERAEEPGWLLVADVGGSVSGFAQAVRLDDGACSWSRSPRPPAHGRRGLGGALADQVCLWVAADGHDRLWLRTYADVPWNAPLYARHGFVPVPLADEAAVDSRRCGTTRSGSARTATVSASRWCASFTDRVAPGRRTARSRTG